MKTNDTLQMTASARRRAISAGRMVRSRSVADRWPVPLRELEQRLARVPRFERQQRALAVEAAGVAGQRAAAADDPMARHDDRQRIAAGRSTRRAHRRRTSAPARELAVADRRTERHAAIALHTPR